MKKLVNAIKNKALPEQKIEDTLKEIMEHYYSLGYNACLSDTGKWRALTRKNTIKRSDEWGEKIFRDYHLLIDRLEINKPNKSKIMSYIDDIIDSHENEVKMIVKVSDDDEILTPII